MKYLKKIMIGMLIVCMILLTAACNTSREETEMTTEDNVAETTETESESVEEVKEEEPEPEIAPEDDDREKRLVKVIMIEDEKENIRQEYSYDADGRVISTKEAQISYDSSGNPISIIEEYDGTCNFSFSYADSGNITMKLNGREYILDSSVDEHGNLLYDFMGNPITYTYDDAGNILTREYYNYTPVLNMETMKEEETSELTKDDYKYDSAGKMTNKKTMRFYTGSHTGKLTEEVVYKASYTYNQSGNVLSEVKEEYDYDEGGFTTEKKEYSYDGAGNLLTYEDKIKYAGSSQYNVLDKQKYQYDEAGNLLSAEKESFGKKFEEFYDESGKLTVKREADGTEVQYEYDENGNETGTKTVNSDGRVISRTENIYDKGGRLLKYLYYSNAGTVKYETDYIYELGTIKQTEVSEMLRRAYIAARHLDRYGDYTYNEEADFRMPTDVWW